MEQMSCTGRFVRPFIRLLSRYPGFDAAALEPFRKVSQQQRINLSAAHETLTRWASSTGDEDLGLKAGELMCLGEGGVLEFAMHSAASVREGMDVANRYARLLSDALEPSLQVDGAQATIRLDSRVDAPRAASDFTLSAWYNTHVRVQLGDLPALEVWIAHEAPADIREYERIFAGAKLRFGAPCYGFAFEAEHADRPLASADASLHAVHCELLESLRARLAEPQSFALRVRELVARELRHGRPTAWSVARQMQISRRTLVRRLAEENTTFKAQLDGLRCQLALSFVASPRLPLTEITGLLGFSRVPAFHRAFRRWTGQTPIQYREAASSAAM